jgi:putative membrane-bound dehydrogenase-like protein
MEKEAMMIARTICSLVMLVAAHLFALPVVVTADVEPHPSRLHSVSATLGQMTVREGYEVVCVAAEPDVIDPISASWSADGKLWVVEMSDYPQPRPGQTERNGRIRVLSDRDSNGRFTKSHTFADGLDFATGVLPYRDGAIVTVAGKIVFLRDADHDGQADETQVWFAGFTTDNEQLRANHPTLGPDGMVYVASGLRGGEIVAVDARFDARSEPLNLHGRDFAFDPNGGEWAAVSGNSQHGLTIDDFSRRFGCSNRNPAIQSVLSLDVVQRDPFLSPGEATCDVAQSGFESKVQPISVAWTTSNLHAGQFSAACGVLAPGWQADDGSQWLLVCEPTGSLVQRQRLTMQNAIWHSERESEATEWLACRDDWFRPVDLIPDVNNSVLVIDMSRAVIEHPQWAPIELQNRPDTLHGNDLGRIWQVRRRSAVAPAPAIHDDASAIEAFQSSDPCVRIRATAYWYGRYDAETLPTPDTIEHLRRVARSPNINATSRARVASLLNRWGLLGDVLATLHQSDNSRLRALGISMSKNNQISGQPAATESAVLTALQDDELLVRQAAMQTLLNYLHHDRPHQPTHHVLLNVAKRDSDDIWMQKLLLAIPVDDIRELLPIGLQSLQDHGRTDVNTNVLAGWMRRIAAHAPDQATEILRSWMIQASRDPEIERQSPSRLIPIASAYQLGVGQKVLEQRDKSTNEFFQTLDSAALAVAMDETSPLAVRLDAIKWIADQPSFPTDVRKLIDERTEPNIRGAAYRLLFQRDAEWAMQAVLDRNNTLAPTDRQAIIDSARRSLTTARWLLTQINDQQLPRNFVDPATMDWYRNHTNRDIAELGRSTFAPPAEIASVLAAYSSTTANLETADLASGKMLFAQHCANCHRIDGVGHEIGPDISDSRTKTPDSLLTAILDPSAAIDASFSAYQVLTVDGEVISGLLVDESADAVTLNMPGGLKRRIARDEIDVFQAMSQSLMPGGIQRAIDLTQMRDLIAYLKRWRYESMDQR